LLLIQFRSDFFKGLVSNNFREGSGRSATLNISTEATEQLVKFLYSFETDKTLSLPTVKELIVYAGVCGLKNLEEALEDNLKTLLNNVHGSPAHGILTLEADHNIQVTGVGLKIYRNNMSLNNNIDDVEIRILSKCSMSRTSYFHTEKLLKKGTDMPDGLCVFKFPKPFLIQSSSDDEPDARARGQIIISVVGNGNNSSPKFKITSHGEKYVKRNILAEREDGMLKNVEFNVNTQCYTDSFDKYYTYSSIVSVLYFHLPN